MKFVEKAMMHIHTAVPIGVGFIAAMGTPEQLAPALFDALAITEGEPPFRYRFFGKREKRLEDFAIRQVRGSWQSSLEDSFPRCYTLF